MSDDEDSVEMIVQTTTTISRLTRSEAGVHTLHTYSAHGDKKRLSCTL